MHDRLNSLSVQRDRLEVRYMSVGVHSHDVGAIRASAPFARDEVVHYFEIEVLDVGARGTIAVGVASGELSLNRFPGCERASYGFHGDDGRCYINGSRGDAYSSAFRRGDIVGCGVIVSRGELFFTRNGEQLPIVARGLAGPFHAVVGLHSLGESIRANFGRTPFAFDVAALVAREQQAHAARLAAIVIEPRLTLELVRRHLLYSGCGATLSALDAATRRSAGDDATSTTSAALLTDEKRQPEQQIDQSQQQQQSVDDTAARRRSLLSKHVADVVALQSSLDARTEVRNAILRSQSLTVLLLF